MRLERLTFGVASGKFILDATKTRSVCFTDFYHVQCFLGLVNTRKLQDVQQKGSKKLRELFVTGYAGLLVALVSLSKPGQGREGVGLERCTPPAWLKEKNADCYVGYFNTGLHVSILYMTGIPWPNSLCECLLKANMT